MTAELQLAKDISQFYDDPEGFVLYVFPWSKPGTQLAQHAGPRKWQREYLQELGRQIKERGFNGVDPVAAIQDATSSGHGIGKSALVAWIILFIMSTRPHAKGIVTAMTSEQLRTKTWAELGKWLNMSVVKHWFQYNTGKGNMSLVYRQAPETWRCDAQTCREENSESFAGLHAAGSTPFYIFDEASGVPDKIWEVSDGGLTDGEPMRLVFGNPTRNSGRFYDAFHRLKHRWTSRQIDSRTVEGTNKELFKEMGDDWGEDSDYFKVRVRGEFPSASDMQFIPTAYVEKARRAPDVEDYNAGRVLGVDVARFGGDQSVIYTRKGRDGRGFPPRKFRGLNTVQLAHKVAEVVHEFHKLGDPVQAIFVDGTGIGAGVVDTLVSLGYNVIEVHNANSPDDPRKYLNKGCEMWGSMRDWLKDGGVIPDDPELHDELTTREYGYNLKGQIKLESKDDMKKRGQSSPDIADGLALTFAYPVFPKSMQQNIPESANSGVAVGVDFDPE